MEISILLSHMPNPRMNKRIKLLKQNHRVSLICWERNTANLWDIVHEDIPNYIIKQKANYGSPIKRIIPTIKFAIKAIKELKRIKPECLYAANADMLAICWALSIFKSKKPKIIYEVADLNKLMIDKQKSLSRKAMQFIARKIEEGLCKNVNLLILTSEKYFDVYFSNFFPLKKVVFMPNMPDLSAFKSYQKAKNDSFTIGFIGVVRYKEQMKMLISAAEQCNINVLFAGSSFDKEIENICSQKQFVEYYGNYSFDIEIAQLYSRCDCIYSVYDADLNNVKVALPNKLYESIYCELPIIVAKNTYLADLVEKMGVGVAVSHKDEDELREVIRRLANDKEYYTAFVEACCACKPEINIERYNKTLNQRIESLN